MATDLVEQGLPCDIFEQLIFERYKSSRVFVHSVLRNNNKLGEGSRASVYRIPALPAYVLNVCHELNDDTLHSETGISAIQDCLPGLNIGQPVASMYGGYACILRFQQGINSRIPFRRFFAKYGIDEILGDDLPMQAEDLLPYRSLYISHLRIISDLPQRAYDQLASHIIQIQQNGLFLDPCSLNLLVDIDSKSFSTVDHQECIGPYENVLGMICLLMDTMFVHMDEHAIYKSDLVVRTSLANDPELVRMRRRILKKALNAAIKFGLKWPSEACPKNVFGFHQSSFDLRYAFRLAGMADRYDEIAALFAGSSDNTDSEVKSLLAA